MKNDHQFTRMVGKICRKITAFSQEILVKDVCVRRKLTLKSHPACSYQISSVAVVMMAAEHISGSN